MATQLETIARIKFKNAQDANKVEDNFERIPAYAQKLDADEEFLGLLAYAFTTNEMKAGECSDKAWRSFIDGKNINDGLLTLYFRSSDWGSKDFFQLLYKISDYPIEEIRITVNDEDESAVEEYGEDFEILISSNSLEKDKECSTQLSKEDLNVSAEVPTQQIPNVSDSAPIAQKVYSFGSESKTEKEPVSENKFCEKTHGDLFAHYLKEIECEELTQAYHICMKALKRLRDRIYSETTLCVTTDTEADQVLINLINKLSIYGVLDREDIPENNTQKCTLKERIEAVLGMTLSEEEFLDTQIKYATFCIEPESYKDSVTLRMIQEDITLHRKWNCNKLFHF